MKLRADARVWLDIRRPRGGDYKEKGIVVTEQDNNSDPSGGTGKLSGRQDATSFESDAVGGPSASWRNSGKRPSKRKPIVNRRGPSEADRAVRISRAKGGRPQPSGRKLPEGAVGYGTVVRVDRAKGFGFLVDAAGEQRFFHRTSVLDGGFGSLKEQQTVQFQAHNDERGARALKVRPSESPERPVKAGLRPQVSPKAPTWRTNLSPFRDGGGLPTRAGGQRARTGEPRA